MRFFKLAALIVVTGACFSVAAEARPFNRGQEHLRSYYSPWCLNTPFGINDCGFGSLEQCLVSRSGIGGACLPNARYVPVNAAPVKKSRRARR